MCCVDVFTTSYQSPISWLCLPPNSVLTVTILRLFAKYRLPSQRPNSYPGQRMRNNAPPTTMDLEAMHGIRYPNWTTEQKLRASAATKRQQNLQAADELMAEESGGLGFESNGNFYMGQVHHLQQQLHNSIGLCQSLMRDQQVMNNMLQGSMSGGFSGLQGPLSAHTPTTPTPSNGDPRMMNLMNDYNMRLQHQQLQLNMNHSYNQLYQQQQEMQRLQVQYLNISLKTLVPP